MAGGELLGEILRDPGMPTRRTVWNWTEAIPEFASRYEAAERAQAAAIVDRAGADVWDENLAPEHVNRSRVRFDFSKFLAAKLDPARWGDRAELQVTVSDPAVETRRQELIAALQRLASPDPPVIDAPD
jgi:hypothetical protein